MWTPERCTGPSDYRTAPRQGFRLEDKAAVTAALEQIRVELRYVGRCAAGVAQRTRMCRRRSARPEISHGSVQCIGDADTVRAFLFDLQRNMALEHDVVMDGRDIGTVVLPDAQVKIYLTASAEERTRRRMAEYEAKGTARGL